MTNTLNLKNMKQAYLNSECDNAVWTAFYTLHCVGMIDRETWVKFFDTCEGWIAVDDKIIDLQFVDGEPVEKVIKVLRG